MLGLFRLIVGVLIDRAFFMIQRFLMIRRLLMIECF